MKIYSDVQSCVHFAGLQNSPFINVVCRMQAQRKTSSCWKFFTKLSTTSARCNECNRKLNCHTTANLKRHLAKTHPELYSALVVVENEKSTIVIKTIEAPCKLEDMSIPEAMLDEKSNASSSSSSCNDDEKFFTVVNAHARKSPTWQYFTSIDEKTASCNICLRKLEYGSTISNLKRHLQIKHIADYKRLVNGEDPVIRTDKSGATEETITFIKGDMVDTSPPKTRASRSRSNIWNYFKKVSNKAAICGLCDRKLSFGASPTNLRRHLRMKHPEEYEELEAERTNQETLKREKKTRNTSSNSSTINFRTRGAKVWQHFQRKDDKVALCYICNKKIYWGCAIGNLKRHIKLIHPNQFSTLTNRTSPRNSRDLKMESDNDNDLDNDVDDVQENGEDHAAEDIPVESDQVPNLPNPKSSKNTDNSNSINLAQADNILMKMIIKHFQDYSVVEEREFSNFVKSLNPSYKLPSKETIANVIMPDMYEDCLFKTQLLVKGCKKFCMTVDSWTNKYKTDFICVTIHFLDSNFNILSVVLKCLPTDINVPENTETELRRILNDWNILEENIVLAVTSNSNIRSVFTSINWSHFDCFAHTINSIVENVFRRDWMIKLVNKSRYIVNYIRGCEMALEKLKECQRNSGANLKLSKDLHNCWMSTFCMLQRFVELEDAVKYALAETQTDVSSLTSSEWHIIRQLIKMLKPLENVISTIKYESYFIASLVIPMVNGMRTLYNNYSTKQLFNNQMLDVLHSIIWSISEHFSDVENCDALTIATFLDPRFKYFAFSNDNTFSRTKHDVIKLLSNSSDSNNVGHENNSPVAEEDEESSIWSSFDKSVSTRISMNEQSRASIEVQRYIEDGLLNRNEDPLKWWRTNKIVYPKLSVLAQDRLCVVASSIQCDRLFTKTGSNTMDNRHRLSLGKTEMFVFLNANYK